MIFVRFAQAEDAVNANAGLLRSLLHLAAEHGKQGDAVQRPALVRFQVQEVQHRGQKVQGGDGEMLLHTVGPHSRGELHESDLPGAALSDVSLPTPEPICATGVCEAFRALAAAWVRLRAVVRRDADPGVVGHSVLLQKPPHAAHGGVNLGDGTPIVLLVEVHALGGVDAPTLWRGDVWDVGAVEEDHSEEGFCLPFGSASGGPRTG